MREWNNAITNMIIELLPAGSQWDHPTAAASGESIRSARLADQPPF
jgi:hypothetical protein